MRKCWSVVDTASVRTTRATATPCFVTVTVSPRAAGPSPGREAVRRLRAAPGGAAYAGGMAARDGGTVRTTAVSWQGTGAHGDTLAGRLEVPRDGAVRAWALFAHCFTCGKDVVAAARIARGLAKRGIGVLRFDFTGIGASGGDFAHTDFSSDVEDLVLAARALTAEDRAPSLLIGHSLGGAAALAAAGRIPSTRAVVTLAAPSHPGHVRRQIPAEDRRRIEAEGEAEVLLAGRPFRIGRGFLEDVAEQPQRERIASLGVPLLVLHSPEDELVPYAEAEEIHRLAAQPKSLVALDGAGHLLADRADTSWAVRLIAAWSARYLPAARPA